MIAVTSLRKIFTEQGVKGFGSANRATFNAAIEAAWDLALGEDAAREIQAAAAAETTPVVIEAEVEAAPVKRGICTDCGRKEDFRASGLCERCREYSEWENEHSDRAHGTEGADEDDHCQVCHPELDRRAARREGRSREGMVIVAKGTEIHKSLLFKREAEAKGWTVELTTETYESGNTRHFADAKKGDEAIQLAWEGRAYDYPSSSAQLGGKTRKVRNLKEALRLI